MRIRLAMCLLVCFLTSIPTWAYDFELNGVYYNITDANAKTVEVTYVEKSSGNRDFYYGAITIPKRVSKENVTYDVKSIGNDAFRYCSDLTSITIPNGVTSIGSAAFKECIGLASITIPNSVTTIGESAFANCIGLTSITIPNSVTSIGNNAFFDCSSLPSITIPDGVTSIESGTFNDCRSLTSITIPYRVTTIGESAFANCIGLTSITIPYSVTSIGGRAFKGCVGLTSITIPNSVTSIGGLAFDDTTWYDNQPDGVVYAGKFAYKYKGTMPKNTKIELEEGTLGIVSGAFSGCSSLTSVTIPNSVTSIGLQAFVGCSGLTSVTIPNSVTSIEQEVFAGCSGLTSVTIPNSVASIGSEAFRNCNGLTSVTIPNSVASIGSEAFRNCNGLTSVHITDLSAWCSISFSEFYSNPLYYAHHLYMNGKEITNLDIPNNVTSIGRFAFSGCSGLTSITIPNSVTSIGGLAFYGCSGLTAVTVDWETPVFSEAFFYSNYQSATLYVPKGTKALYEAADWWKDFGKIVEIGEITIGDNGIGTYCSTNALDFSSTDDVKAYIVSAFKPSTGEVTLTRITDVPANTGIVVKGAVGTYSIPVGPGETIVLNMLRGVTTNTVLNKVEGDYTNYILAKKNGNLGFYAVVDGSTLSAGKAYLPLPTASLPSSARSIKLVFEDGGTTGISDASPLNDNEEMQNDNVYDLQGRRVEKPTRGLYIVNGRKVVIK